MTLYQRSLTYSIFAIFVVTELRHFYPVIENYNLNFICLDSQDPEVSLLLYTVAGISVDYVLFRILGLMVEYLGNIVPENTISWCATISQYSSRVTINLSRIAPTILSLSFLAGALLLSPMFHFLKY